MFQTMELDTIGCVRGCSCLYDSPAQHEPLFVVANAEVGLPALILSLHSSIIFISHGPCHVLYSVHPFFNSFVVQLVFVHM